jgi:hypothetical protein
MKWILFVFFLTMGSGNDTSPFGPAVQTTTFTSRESCERALKDLGAWAEKTYRYKNLVIARLDGVCIPAE